MRLQVIFPPRTSPTYTPIGCATLAGLSLPAGVETDWVDANVELWEELSCQVVGGLAMSRFWRGQEGDFYDPSHYRVQAAVQGRVLAAIEEMRLAARLYLETGELAAGLGGWLAGQTVRQASFGADLLGLSVVFPEQLSLALALAKYRREVADLRQPIILGGAMVSALQGEELLEAFPFIDGLAYHEGEATWMALASGASLAEVPGLLFRRGGGSERTPAAAPTAWPAANYSVLPLSTYFNPVSVLSISGSRGCSWRRCRFCVHNLSFGQHRRRHAELLVAEMAACQERFGTRHFYLVDQDVDALALEALSRAILAAGFDCSFQAMARPTADYTPERLELAYAAGCRWISWGVESGSQRLLDLVDKGLQVAAVEQVLRQASQAGISNLMMMIFGLPTSSPADLEATLSFIARVYPHVDAMTSSSFALFEATAFARRPQRHALELVGREELYRLGGRSVHSSRLHFRRRQESGKGQSDLGRREIAAWERRRAWLGEPSFLEGLPCEHYLIHVARRAEQQRPPVKPFDPFTPFTPPVAPLRRAS